jgi:hypothetical protein
MRLKVSGSLPSLLMIAPMKPGVNLSYRTRPSMLC